LTNPVKDHSSSSVSVKKYYNPAEHNKRKGLVHSLTEKPNKWFTQPSNVHPKFWILTG